jgi:hypothetical protein
VRYETCGDVGALKGESNVGQLLRYGPQPGRQIRIPGFLDHALRV